LRWKTLTNPEEILLWWLHTKQMVITQSKFQDETKNVFVNWLLGVNRMRFVKQRNRNAQYKKLDCYSSIPSFHVGWLGFHHFI
jgi:hypothetical protein